MFVSAILFVVLACMFVYAFYFHQSNRKKIEHYIQQALQEVKEKGFVVDRCIRDCTDLHVLFDQQNRNIAFIYGNIGEVNEPMAVEYLRDEQYVSYDKWTSKRGSKSYFHVRMNFRKHRESSLVFSFLDLQTAQTLVSILKQWQQPEQSDQREQSAESTDDLYDVILLTPGTDPAAIQKLMVDRLQLSEEEAQQRIAAVPTFLCVSQPEQVVVQWKIKLEAMGASLEIQRTIEDDKVNSS
jgi:hypothetical protein